MLQIPGFEGHGAQLLFFCLFVVQISDVLQHVFGKLFGRRKLAPRLSPSKTWEGRVGGGVSAAPLGAKDWGNTIARHGGFMDRLDSLTFAAPVFSHVVRWPGRPERRAGWPQA